MRTGLGVVVLFVAAMAGTPGGLSAQQDSTDVAQQDSVDVAQQTRPMSPA